MKHFLYIEMVTNDKIKVMVICGADSYAEDKAQGLLFNRTSSAATATTLRW